jgi:NAD(P)-dependent dehydrogenase (short-subunit alcohol dehydrogenase family)
LSSNAQNSGAGHAGRSYERTVVITGAGSGLGEALACRYAAAGWRVAVTDVNAERAQAVLGRIIASGGAGFAMGLDVRDEDHWAGLEREVRERWGGLGHLVSNAGVAASGTVADTPAEDWDWVLEINLLGVVRGCRRFARLMAAQGSGHLVNMASFAGLAGAPGMSSYGVAKAGVVALSEGLRAELHGSGVGVSVVCPAFVATRLTETMRATTPGAVAQVERWMQRSPVAAEALAEQVFREVAAGRFLILTHPQTRRMWRFKRWFPERYFKLMIKRLS